MTLFWSEPDTIASWVGHGSTISGNGKASLAAQKQEPPSNTQTVTRVVRSPNPPRSLKQYVILLALNDSS